MDIASVLTFGLVLLFTTVAGMLSVKLKIPPVVGLLTVGMLLGPNVLNIANPSEIDTFAEIGAILLLFMIGAEFSIAKLLATGLRTVVGGLILILVTFIVMYETAVMLGLDAITSLFIAAAFSMSSTAIIMKVLEQKGLVERQEVPILITILIIEDVFAVFMLTFFSSLKSGSYATEGILGSILVSLGVLGFGYFILNKVIQKISDVFLRYQAEDTLILFSFGLCIIMAVSASLLGLTPSIGAFLAGSIIAGLPNGKAFEDAIRPFSLLFSAFFFLSIGMLIDPFAVLATANTTLLLVGMFVITVSVATTFVFFLISSDGRSSLFAGLAMIPLGEFSLLIARESVGIAQINLVEIVSVGVLITSMVCSFVLGRTEQIYHIIRKSLSPQSIQTLVNASKYFRRVVGAFEPDGYFHVLFIREIKDVGVDLLLLLSGAILFFFTRSHFQFNMFFAGFTFKAEIALAVIIILFSLVPLIRLLISLKRIFDALSSIFSYITPQATKTAILRNLLISLIFLGIFIAAPTIVDMLALPRVFYWLSFVFGALSVLFLWGVIRAASFSFSLKAGRPLGLFRERVKVSKRDVVVVGRKKNRYPPKGR